MEKEARECINFSDKDDLELMSLDAKIEALKQKMEENLISDETRNDLKLDGYRSEDYEKLDPEAHGAFEELNSHNSEQMVDKDHNSMSTFDHFKASMPLPEPVKEISQNDKYMKKLK